MAERWISLAGPLAGGVGAAVCWGIGEQQHSRLLQALGYVGFLLNLFNLLPIGFLDGGSIWRCDQDDAARRHARARRMRATVALRRPRRAPACSAWSPRTSRSTGCESDAATARILEHDDGDIERARRA